MVLDEQLQSSCDGYQCESDLDLDRHQAGDSAPYLSEKAATTGEIQDEAQALSFKMPYQQSFRASHWAQLAETTLPLRTSKLMCAEPGSRHTYGCLDSESQWPGFASDLELIRTGGSGGGAFGGKPGRLFQASIECRSKQMSRKLILVTLISLLINLLLALVALYFSFASNISSGTAFAADCLLDFISSAIVLWRYYGDDSNGVYAEAREQIACIYLGALFEISALGIIIKASSDMLSGSLAGEAVAPGYGLVYLAAVATAACSALIWFKWSLYRTIRDKSILLDVINTLISTIFALTLCLMTVLSNADSSFLYFDPILSILLALFMAGFGLKVIHQNINILRPGHRSSSRDGSAYDESLLETSLVSGGKAAGQRADPNSAPWANWQRDDCSAIQFS